MPKKVPTILAVDDESDILLILQTALSEDYAITTADSGAEALESIEEKKPDLIILDMMMPEMDGLQTLKNLRNIPGAESIPVLFLTGAHSKDVMREALKAGTAYYLNKPFDYNELISKVEIALKESEG